MSPSSVSTAPANVIARVAAMVAAGEKLGKTASLAELIGATTTGEKLLAFGAVYASFWLGAAVGSLIVATADYAECGKSASATMQGGKFTFSTGIRVPAGILFVLQTNPKIFSTGSTGRAMFAKKAAIPAAQVQAAGAR
ncbi:hypothetical protein [Paraburkholderia sp. GAS199]|uniref:hypothetical protein n=1 Tax=Paraburkholderia sp. GAS199 TaxID=3035126 RepID=UPI003D1BE9FF